MEVRVLGNGLTVIVVENHATPLLTIEFDVRNGAFTEDGEFNGLSHLYEHMFFKANASLPSQERYMARIRELGAEFNGTTSTERVNYYITLHRDRLREGLEFMAAALRTPLFDEKELERERIVVEAEYDRMESQPNFHLNRAVGRLLWGDAYYSRKNPIGSRQVLREAPVDKLRLIQSRYYLPNNTALILSGALDAEEGFQLAALLFSDWRKGPDPMVEFPVPFPPPLGRPEAVVVRQPVRTVVLRVAWQGPSLSLDPEGSYAMELICDILNQPGSKFQKRLLDSGLCTSADLDYFSQNYVGPINLYLETSTEHLFKALETALASFDDLVEPGFISDEEIREAKDRLEVHQIFEREDPTAYAHTIGFWFATAGIDYLRTYLEKIRASGRSSLELTARRYFIGKPQVVGALISPEDAEALGLTRESLLARSASRSRPARRSAAEPELFSVDGIEVLFKPNPDTEVVAVQTYFRGGVRNGAPGQAGIERFLFDVARRGSVNFSRAEVEQFLSRTGGALRTAAGREFSRFSFYGARRHLEAGLDLMFDLLVHPAMEAREVELTLGCLNNEIKHKQADPQYILAHRALGQYFAGHPYSIEPDGTLESLASIGMQQLRSHHSMLLERPRLLVVAVGSLDREKLLAALEKRLALFRPADLFLPPLPRPAAAGRQQLLSVERDQPTNHLLALFEAPSITSPEYPAFYVAMDYLNHRLFEEVRTKRNLAYSMHAGAGSLAVNYGRISLISVDPKSCLEVIAEELRRLRERPIDAKSLADTVSQLRTGLLQQRVRASSQADELGRAHIIGGDWRRAERFEQEAAEVTPEQVQESIRRFVRGWSAVLLGDPRSVPQEFFLSLDAVLN